MTSWRPNVKRRFPSWKTRNLSMPQKIGLFGGTFDPPHLGHLIAAQEVQEKLKLDRIFFIPASLPPHKKKVKISRAIHRLKMVQLATQDNPNFKVLDLELKRKGH